MGAATAAITLFRTLSGSIAVAIFGALSARARNWPPPFELRPFSPGFYCAEGLTLPYDRVHSSAS